MFELRFHVPPTLVRRFAEFTGDWSSLHTDPSFGSGSMYGRNIVHGFLQVVFLAGLDLQLADSPEPVDLKRLTIRFAKPVFPGDGLVLQVTHLPPTPPATSVEADFSIRDAVSGLVTTMGSVVLDRGTAHGPMRRMAEGEAARPSMLVDPVTEAAPLFDDIARLQVARFRYRVTEAHARALYDMIGEGLSAEPRAPDFATWLTRRRPSNLLASTMCSTLVGMSLPGRYAVLTDASISFSATTEFDREYELTGSVAFKTASTWTVVATVVVRDSSLGFQVASGRVGSQFDIEHSRNQG